jgi:Bacterial capsule synthesis protein PGA_cap
LADAPDAVRPAIVTQRGQRFAFLGCTTITEPIEEGRVLAEDQVSYVATKTKAGAAACDPSEIAGKVRALKQRVDVVIVMVHGGYEYEPDPSPTVRAVSRAARKAGANLVVNHHPHVVGGLESEEGGLTAWTLGNFVFDQTIWPTFLSYMLTVDVRDGEVIRSYVDPLIIEGFRPVPVTGETAGMVADIVERHSSQASVLSDGSVVFAQETDSALERDVQLGSPDGSSLWRLHPDTTLEEPGDLELGHDLLWVGSFEDDDVDRDEGEGALWQRGPDVSIGPSAARTGRLGARMQRSAANCGDVFLNPLHRILVEGGTELSVVGWIRPSDADVSASLQLSWYDDTKGPSRTWSLVDLPVGPPGRWVPFRVDVPAPSWAVAVGPYLRLAAPGSGQLHLDVDDLAVVSWTQSPEHGRGFGFVRAAGSRTITLAAVAAEGTQATAPRAPERLPAAETMEPPTNQEPQPTPECPSSAMQLPRHHEWWALPIKKASSPDSIHVIGM